MSTLINDGDAAFPRPVSFCEEGGTHRGTLGMSLRDYYAGQALAGMLSEGRSNSNAKNWMPEESYEIADAMLAAREAKL